MFLPGGAAAGRGSPLRRGAGRFFGLAFRSPEWAKKVRVGENRQGYAHHIFADENRNKFPPLCTPMVCPPISGVTVERRDQVRTTWRWRVSFIAGFFHQMLVDKGSFFNERARLLPFLLGTIILIRRVIFSGL